MAKSIAVAVILGILLLVPSVVFARSMLRARRARRERRRFKEDLGHARGYIVRALGRTKKGMTQDELFRSFKNSGRIVSRPAFAAIISELLGEEMIVRHGAERPPRYTLSPIFDQESAVYFDDEARPTTAGH